MGGETSRPETPTGEPNERERVPLVRVKSNGDLFVVSDYEIKTNEYKVIICKN